MEHSKPINRRWQVENRFSSRVDVGLTLATQAYDRLLADLLSGAIAPGARLHIRDHCLRLGVGLSPMREALNRLAAQGFVVQSDQRGFTAAPLDLVDLADLTLARAAVNEAALRDALSHGSTAWEEALVLAHHRLARVPRVAGDTTPEWEDRHRGFHAALVAGCRSARLRLYCGQLFVMSDRYRRVSRIATGTRDVAAEHAEILDAAVTRDADRAVHLLEAHVQRTEALVRSALGAAV